MYSMVLVMALSSGPEAPAGLFHKKGGAAPAPAASSCGCAGMPCGGCNTGCGCYGYSGCGCYGYSGGGYGGGCGCHGYSSGCGCQGYSGCGYGGGGCYGYSSGCGCYGYGGGMMVPGGAPYGTPPTTTPTTGTEKKISGVNANAALIVVHLPADAKLTVDGHVTESTSATRTFSTPSLTPGQEYQSTLRAEIVRDGKTIAMEKEIVVRAGETTNVELAAPTAAVVLK